MASRVELFPVTVPANTPIATPVNIPTPFNTGNVERLEIIIPPGFSGLVGFRITHSGSVVIPYQYTQWVITDNEKIEWPLQEYPTGGAWGVQAYNTDVYNHTMYLRYLIVETQRFALTAVEPLTIIQAAPSAVE